MTYEDLQVGGIVKYKKYQNVKWVYELIIRKDPSSQTVATIGSLGNYNSFATDLTLITSSMRDHV